MSYRSLDVTQQLSVHQNSLYRWVNEYEEYGESAFPGNGSTIYDYQATIHCLERRNRELDEEVELLKKIQGLPAHQKSARFQYLVEQQHRYSIRKACMTLGISRSGFYASCARTPSGLQLENEVLSQKIREVFEQHSGRYGAKRIAHSLQDEGIKVNRKRIVKLMRTMGLYVKGARRAYKHYKKHHSNRATLDVFPWFSPLCRLYKPHFGASNDLFQFPNCELDYTLSFCIS